MLLESEKSATTPQLRHLRVEEPITVTDSAATRDRTT